uniref:Uncharacterized protein n=1 Tax=Anguilla anguilla TaxID=7936 RepID=A0A0E9TWS8_ANGAN
MHALTNIAYYNKYFYKHTPFTIIPDKKKKTVPRSSQKND